MNAVVAVDRVALAQRLPRTGAGGVERGYSGRPSDAVLSVRRLPERVRTSGVLTRPEVMSISPLGIGVTLGYQRPAAMFGPRPHVYPRGSKMCV